MTPLSRPRRHDEAVFARFPVCRGLRARGYAAKGGLRLGAGLCVRGLGRFGDKAVPCAVLVLAGGVGKGRRQPAGEMIAAVLLPHAEGAGRRKRPRPRQKGRRDLADGRGADGGRH